MTVNWDPVEQRHTFVHPLWGELEHGTPLYAHAYAYLQGGILLWLTGLQCRQLPSIMDIRINA